MCQCTSTNTTSTCSQCTSTCSGCQYTLNTDCVIFNKEKLSFENDSVISNSNRTLTSVLQSFSPVVKKTSEFHAIADGDFTLSVDAADKITILEDPDASSGLTATIYLPVNSLDFAGKSFTFINKTPVASGAWSFNVPLVVDYDPLTTQTAYNSIVSASSKVLVLAFIQTTPTSYAWTILQN